MSDAVITAVVDRIEGAFAVCVCGDAVIDVPLDGHDIAEGDSLRLKERDGAYTVLSVERSSGAAERERRHRLSVLFDRKK